MNLIQAQVGPNKIVALGPLLPQVRRGVIFYFVGFAARIDAPARRIAVAPLA